MSQRMTIDQTNRTFICSVVFVDLVDYSKKSVVEQLAIKDYFTGRLAEGLKDVAVNDRIVLDTGDGAAMSFLGDPEDALFVGMSLRDSMKSGQDAAAAVKEPCSIRIGINLGPIKLVRDINGQPNIVGDGINVAQRIMSFAQPGQILVSRSYYDVVSCLSEEYGKLFTYDGSRTDKHVREHDVYVVGESESAFIHAKTGMEHRAAQTNPRLRIGAGSAEAKGAQTGAHGFSAGALGRGAVAFLHDRRKVMLAGGVLGAVIVLLGVLLAVRKPAVPGVESPVASAARAAAPAEASVKRGTQERAAAPEAVAQPEATTAAAAAVAPGTVHLAISPWGEVYVNGKSRGISPPMKSLKLPPGKYRIEIRNSAFPPRTEAIEVRSRREVTIKQVFK